VHLLDQLLQVRHRDLGQGEAGQVRVTELEDLRPEREPAAVAAHVAELDQRAEEAAGGGAAQPGACGHLAQGKFRVLRVEGADHGQAAFE
jgi:hypothetical protein